MLVSFSLQRKKAAKAKADQKGAHDCIDGISLPA
jgi:hypothetical protein